MRARRERALRPEREANDGQGPVRDRSQGRRLLPGDCGERILVSHDKGEVAGGSLVIEEVRWCGLAAGDGSAAISSTMTVGGCWRA